MPEITQKTLQNNLQYSKIALILGCLVQVSPDFHFNKIIQIIGNKRIKILFNFAQFLLAGQVYSGVSNCHWRDRQKAP